MWGMGRDILGQQVAFIAMMSRNYLDCTGGL